MTLAELVDVSRRVGDTRSRRDKIEHLAAGLRGLAPAEVQPAVAFLSGDIPGGKIGVGPAAVGAARSSPAHEPSLAILDLARELDAIRAASGTGAGRERRERLELLMARATAPEQDFVARLAVGELRQGALQKIMVEAVARAAGVAPRAVRRALMVGGDLGEVATAALAGGRAGLEPFSLRLFSPVMPMLAQPADDAAGALAQLGEARLETKLDGARIQVHKQGDDVRVYSRRLNDVTAAVPEVAEAVRGASARELVLDGEVLALRGDGAPHPFQVTMRRFGRRLDVDALRLELPLQPLFFDCLYAGGEDVTDRSAADRRRALAEAVRPDLLVPHVVTGDPAGAEAFVREALARGHEGAVAKDLDSPYEAGSRGSAWLKVKPAHTLDLVVLAAEWGHGRRRGWLSNLHLGARDPGAGGFVMLGKTFKGLTDAMLAEQTRRLLELEVERDAHVVRVRPELVVEIALSDVQTSSHYPAGLALRFARVKRYRDDKRAEDADTIAGVRALSRA